jgi:hypothetical protein
MPSCSGLALDYAPPTFVSHIAGTDYKCGHHMEHVPGDGDL